MLRFEWFGSAVEATPLLVGFAFVLALLVLGMIAAFLLPASQPGKWSDLGPRMRSWWVTPWVTRPFSLPEWRLRV